jgi:hypothetical protein
MKKTFQKYIEYEMRQREAVYTSLPDGRLNPESMGWSRHAVQVSNLRGAWPRKKRWNYWCIVTPDFLFSVTLSNIDYMGLAFAYLLDFKSKMFIEQTCMAPFGKGCDLPETVEGTARFHDKDMDLAFSDDGHFVVISLQSSNFQGKKLDARIHLERPDGTESINVMIPWNEHQYHFTSKQNCLPAGGTVQVEDTTYTINPERDFGCLDFGRGIWKYHTFWNWSSFSTRVDADAIGINLGNGWTEGSGATESGLLINGKVEKLSEDIIFEYDPAHFMETWHLHTAFSNQVNLTFTPFYERVAKTDLWILRSEVHQMIGTFNGKISSLDGRVFFIKDVIGWAEDHQARW